MISNCRNKQIVNLTHPADYEKHYMKHNLKN